jgi:hypothetical protein
MEHKPDWLWHLTLNTAETRKPYTILKPGTGSETLSCAASPGCSSNVFSNQTKNANQQNNHDRQERLLTTIRAAWDQQVTELLRAAGDDFAYEPLSPAEKRLLADSLNVCNIPITNDPTYLN